MKRIMLLSLVLFLGSVSLAWADKEAYKLMMNKEKEVCAAMLKLFNVDWEKHGEVMFEEHKEFIQWEPMTYGGDEFRLGLCGKVTMAKFDINNDSEEDLVIKASLCLRDIPTDALFVFRPNADRLSMLTWDYLFHEHEDKLTFTEDGYDLRGISPSAKSPRTPNIGRPIRLEPFSWKQRTFVSLTDIQSDWIVIAKYHRGQTLEDVCYYRRTASR